MYPYEYNDYYEMQRQQPSVQFIPPTVITQYLNQWIETSIQGYGRVVAYVLDYNQRTGMVSLFIYQAPNYQQQYIQVHHSDLVGISPYFGPTPPRPSRPRPRPPWSPGQGQGPWNPPGQQPPWTPPGQQPGRPPGRPPGQQPWYPGYGGGWIPWLWQGVNMFGSGQQPR